MNLFVEVEPFKTPKGDIATYRDDDGELWVQQNNLTVALGYNKFISLSKKRGSGLGKYLSTNNAVKKHKNCNLINYKMLVDGILPEFIKNYRRELFGQPSRHNFIKFNIDAFITRAKTVLTCLKGESEMITSPESKAKGDWGEQVAKKILENLGYKVERPAGLIDPEKSQFDFIVTDRLNNVSFNEVKAQKSFPYAYGQFATFSIPLAQFESYKRSAQGKKSPVFLAFVDPRTGFMYQSDIFDLEKGGIFDGRQFPVKNFSEYFNGEMIWFSLRQFPRKYPLKPDELAKGRELFNCAETSIDIQAEFVPNTQDTIPVVAEQKPVETPTPVEESPPAKTTTATGKDEYPVFDKSEFSFRDYGKIRNNGCAIANRGTEIYISFAFVMKNLTKPKPVSTRTDSGIGQMLKQSNSFIMIKGLPKGKHLFAKINKLIDHLKFIVDNERYGFVRLKNRPKYPVFLKKLQEFMQQQATAQPVKSVEVDSLPQPAKTKNRVQFTRDDLKELWFILDDIGVSCVELKFAETNKNEIANNILKLLAEAEQFKGKIERVLKE